MSEITVTEHEIRPYFDMEGFMTLSQESRLGGATLERTPFPWFPSVAVTNVYFAVFSRTSAF